jgi:hypothetical protein
VFRMAHEGQVRMQNEREVTGSHSRSNFRFEEPLQSDIGNLQS